MLFIILTLLNFSANAKIDYETEKDACYTGELGMETFCINDLNRRVRDEQREELENRKDADLMGPVPKPVVDAKDDKLPTKGGTLNPDSDPSQIRGPANTKIPDVDPILKAANLCMEKEVIGSCGRAVDAIQMYLMKTETDKKFAVRLSQACTTRCNINNVEPKKIDGCSVDGLKSIMRTFDKLSGGEKQTYCTTAMVNASNYIDPKIVTEGGEEISPRIANVTTTGAVENADGSIVIKQAAIYDNQGQGLLAIGQENQTFVQNNDGTLAAVDTGLTPYVSTQPQGCIGAASTPGCAPAVSPIALGAQGAGGFIQTPETAPIPLPRPETPVTPVTPTKEVAKTAVVPEKVKTPDTIAQTNTGNTNGNTNANSNGANTGGDSSGNSNGGGSGSGNGGGSGFNPFSNSKLNEPLPSINNAALETPERAPVTINKTGSTGSIGGTYLGNGSSSESTKGSGGGSETTSNTANGGTEGLAAAALTTTNPKLSTASLGATPSNLNNANALATPGGLTFASIKNSIGEFFSGSKSSIYGSSNKRAVASVNPRAKKPKGKAALRGSGLLAAQYKVPGCNSGKPECLIAFITGPNNNAKGTTRRPAQVPQYYSTTNSTRLPAGVTSGREDVMSRLVQFYNDKLELDEDGYIEAQ